MIRLRDRLLRARPGVSNKYKIIWMCEVCVVIGKHPVTLTFLW